MRNDKCSENHHNAHNETLLFLHDSFKFYKMSKLKEYKVLLLDLQAATRSNTNKIYSKARTFSINLNRARILQYFKRCKGKTDFNYVQL